jgi:hypothetical protein
MSEPWAWATTLKRLARPFSSSATCLPRLVPGANFTRNCACTRGHGLDQAGGCGVWSASDGGGLRRCVKKCGPHRAVTGGQRRAQGGASMGPWDAVSQHPSPGVVHMVASPHHARNACARSRRPHLSLHPRAPRPGGLVVGVDVFRQKLSKRRPNQTIEQIKTIRLLLSCVACGGSSLLGPGEEVHHEIEGGLLQAPGLHADQHAQQVRQQDDEGGTHGHRNLATRSGGGVATCTAHTGLRDVGPAASSHASQAASAAGVACSRTRTSVTIALPGHLRQALSQAPLSKRASFLTGRARAAGALEVAAPTFCHLPSIQARSGPPNLKEFARSL